MKKTLLLSAILVFLFNGCFFSTIEKINPFSKTTSKTKKEIQIPDNAPTWLLEKKLKNNISAIGVSKIVDKNELEFYKQKALIGASHNLTKKIYVKTVNIYKAYLSMLDDPKVFDKDIKKYAEHVSLKSLKQSKLKNSWIESEKRYFVQIAVESSIIAKEIQNSSKKLFDVNKQLYHGFLSKRAYEDTIKYLEE